MRPRRNASSVGPRACRSTRSWRAWWTWRSRASNVRRRTGKDGLGRCYLDAFAWVQEHAPGYGIVIQTDADFSHDPEMLPLLIERARTYGVAVGSRYVQGGSTPDWDHRRVLLSRGGNLYARTVLRLFYPSYPVRDNTAGFIVWRADVLRSVLKQPVMGDGYSFLTALKFVAFRLGFPAIEVPIVFRDRTLGASKLNKRIILEAVGMPWRLGWKFRKPLTAYERPTTDETTQ